MDENSSKGRCCPLESLETFFLDFWFLLSATSSRGTSARSLGGLLVGDLVLSDVAAGWLSISDDDLENTSDATSSVSGVSCELNHNSLYLGNSC